MLWSFTNQIFISVDITFFENIPYYQKSFSQGESDTREDTTFVQYLNYDHTLDLIPLELSSPGITLDKSNESLNLDRESKPTSPYCTTLPSIESNLLVKGKIKREGNFMSEASRESN